MLSLGLSLWGRRGGGAPAPDIENPYNYGLLTPAGNGGILLPSGAISISSGNAANHFEVASGRVRITAAGVSAALSGSPYTLTFDNAATMTITAVANMRSFAPGDSTLGFRINTDLLAAINESAAGSGNWSNAATAILELRPETFVEADDTENIRRAGRLFPFIVRGDNRHPRPNITGQNFDIDNTDFLQFDWLRFSDWSGSWFVTSSTNAQNYNNAAFSLLQIIGTPDIDATTYSGGQLGKNGINAMGRNLRIEGCYIEGVNRGISGVYLGTLNVNNNVVRNFTEDTVQIQDGGYSEQEGGSISRNYFYGSLTDPVSVAHPDFIQFLARVKGLKVNQNIGVHGDAQGTETQCIFSNGAFNEGEIVGNVFITKNSIHGISVQGMSQSAVLHNSIISTSGSLPNILPTFNDSSIGDDVLIAGNALDGTITTTGVGAATYLVATNNSVNVTDADAFEGGFLPTTYAATLAAMTSKGALIDTSPHDRGAVTGALSFGSDPLSATGYDLPASALVYPPRPLRAAQVYALKSGATTAELTILNWVNLPYQQLTDIEYRVNAGAWTSSGLTGNGAVEITAAFGDDVDVRTVNAGGASAERTVTVSTVIGSTVYVDSDAATSHTLTLDEVNVATGQEIVVALQVGAMVTPDAVTIAGIAATVTMAPNSSGAGFAFARATMTDAVADPNVVVALPSSAVARIVGYWIISTDLAGVSVIDVQATEGAAAVSQSVNLTVAVDDLVLFATHVFGGAGFAAVTFGGTVTGVTTYPAVTSGSTITHAAGLAIPTAAGAVTATASYSPDDKTGGDYAVLHLRPPA